MLLHHIGLNCKDPIETEKFYTKHFGFQRARVLTLSDNKQIVFLKSGSVYLELFQADGTDTNPVAENDGPTVIGFRHLAFSVDDVDMKIAEMSEDAIVSFGPLSFDDVIPGWRAVWVRDPDGNIVEISQNYVDEDNPPPLK